MNPQSYKISYGKHEIVYELRYVDRKTMEVTVHPDMSVIVKVPLGTQIIKIETKLKKKARWILKQQTYFQQFQPRMTERLYLSGETHFYLGKRYQLKVIEDQQEKVQLKNGSFYVCTKDISQNKVQKLMIEWYRQKAKEHFQLSLDQCWSGKIAQTYKQPRIQVKILKKRWGSLSPGGILTLNLELIKAPKECINYVITHELSHLIYPNHNKAFYQLLEEQIPNWKKIKQKLEIFMS